MNVKINTIKLIAILALFIPVCFLTFCKRNEVKNAQAAADAPREKWANEPIQPIPMEVSLDAGKVALGEKLFHETQLSHDNTIACVTCHSMSMGGTDRLPHSKGINGEKGDINAPTVFNAVYNFKQFWDGRAETLEAQIDGPTHAANEMGSSWEEITEKLNRSPEYVSHFAQFYQDGINTENIKDAIATFERSLITPDARFDQFLKGNQEILTKEEKEGYRTFKSVGCISCHQGMNAGGNLFQEFGVMGDYFRDRGNITKADLGRYNVTNEAEDKYVFKVPSLRNVSQTYPYFHDGSAKTLEEAVAIMSKYQLGRELSPHEINSIVLFLKTLDGNYQRQGQ